MSRRWRAQVQRDRRRPKPASARPYRRLFVAGAVAVAVLAATAVGHNGGLAKGREQRPQPAHPATGRGGEHVGLDPGELVRSRAGRRRPSGRAPATAPGNGTILKGQLAQTEDQLARPRASWPGTGPVEPGAEPGRPGAEPRRSGPEPGRSGAGPGRARHRNEPQARRRTRPARPRASSGQHASSDLSATQANAALCQQGAALGQQDVQLLTTLVFLENAYLAAAQAKDSSADATGHRPRCKALTPRNKPWAPGSVPRSSCARPGGDPPPRSAWIRAHRATRVARQCLPKS